MNTNITYTSKEISIEAQGASAGIRGLILKIIKALSFDAEAIFKSKDWPYLWKK